MLNDERTLADYKSVAKTSRITNPPEQNNLLFLLSDICTLQNCFVFLRK